MAGMIGILGGMGPMATVDLMREIVGATKASRDQEHIPMLADSNCLIPDRTAAIVADGPSPLPELIRSAQRLESAGASVLVMACNTAHYFYDDIQPHIHTPMMHMIRETAAVAKGLGFGTVGLLATEGTYAAKIFDQTFAEMDLTVLQPPPEDRSTVMEVIYKVKQGDESLPPDALQPVADRLADRGAKALILGCTELPLAVQRCPVSQQTLNPTLIAACRLIESLGYPLRDDLALIMPRSD